MRNTIEDVFGCPVYIRYGAAEVGRVAAECKNGRLHVFSFNNHVEVLNSDDSPTLPGDVGRIVVTPLHNLAMPLIRYDIGDLARVSSEPCDCGSCLPCWDEIAGRVSHHFVRSDGGLVRGGSLIDMLYEYAWIMQCHVLQEDVDQIRISYTRTPGDTVPASDIDTLNRAVQNAMGEPCRVTWEEVPQILKSTAGKSPLVRSLVWEKRAET